MICAGFSARERSFLHVENASAGADRHSGRGGAGALDSAAGEVAVTVCGVHHAGAVRRGGAAGAVYHHQA